MATRSPPNVPVAPAFQINAPVPSPSWSTYIRLPSAVAVTFPSIVIPSAVRTHMYDPVTGPVVTRELQITSRECVVFTEDKVAVPLAATLM